LSSQLKIDDVSALDAVDEVEDDISDPDEDTLAGQMAMMKGQKVKKAAIEEDSVDSSDTDGDNDSDSSSDSD
jgi:translocation protein SEC63